MNIRFVIFAFLVGVLSGVVGYNVIQHWQAWVLIIGIDTAAFFLLVLPKSK